MMSSTAGLNSPTASATISIRTRLIYIGINPAYVGTAELCGYQLEAGNKATDWRPAPEDVDSAIDEIIAIIRDDGIGMTQSRLAEIKESISMNELADTEHIGLTNTAHRLNLFYGKNNLLSVESTLNKGTTVQIKIPREYVIAEA